MAVGSVYIARAPSSNLIVNLGSAETQLTYDTEVNTSTDIVRQSGNQAYRIQETGLYLVIANTRLNYADIGNNNRHVVRTTIKIGGSVVGGVEGMDAGYGRDSGAADEDGAVAFALIDHTVVGSSADDITIHIQNFGDTSVSLADQLANESGVQIIRLDDTAARLKVRRTTSLAASSGSLGYALTDPTWNEFGWETQVEETDSAVIEWVSGNDITLKIAGHYLVGYFVEGVCTSGGRRGTGFRLTLDDVEVPASRQTNMLRNIDGANEDWSAWCGIINASIDDILNIHWGNISELTGGTKNIVNADMFVLKLPDTASYIRVNHGVNRPGETTGVYPMGVEDEDTEGIHSIISNTDRLNGTADDYDWLLFGSWWARTAAVDSTRVTEHFRWSRTGVIQQFGSGLSYHRGDQSTTGVPAAAGCSAIVAVALGSAEWMAMNLRQESGTGNQNRDFIANTVGITGVALQTLAVGGPDTESVSDGVVIGDSESSSVTRPVYITSSTNIVDGAATSRLLSVPAGKVAGDFVAGTFEENITRVAISMGTGPYVQTHYRWRDDTAGTDWLAAEDTRVVDQGGLVRLRVQIEDDSNFSEWEFAIFIDVTQYSDGDILEFRLTDDGVALTTYDVTVEYEIGSAADVETVTDGIQLGDSSSNVIIVPLSLSDGVQIGDSLSDDILARDSDTDGISIGDSVVSGVLINTNNTDGIDVGDIEFDRVVVRESLLDGINIGDAESGAMSTGEALSDGINIGDDSSDIININRTLTDGLELGDIPSDAIIGIQNASDGIVFGDVGTQDSQLDFFVTDGVLIGESTTPVSIIRESVADGIDLGDSAVGGSLPIQISVSDGIEMGDSESDSLTIPRSTIDGINIGDSSIDEILLSESVIEGINVGDSPLDVTSIVESVADGVEHSDVVQVGTDKSAQNTDGVELGDIADSNITATDPNLDGINIGDISDAVAISVETVTDGVEFGDVVSLNLISSNDVDDGIDIGDTSLDRVLVSESVSDGLIISDAVQAASAGQIEESVSDGIEIGDTPQDITQAVESNSDGVVIGDSVTAGTIIRISVSDGLLIGDSTTSNNKVEESTSDGISLSDSEAIDILIQLSVLDGLILGDGSIGSKYYRVSLIDGIELSETLDDDLIITSTVVDGIVLGDLSSEAAVIEVGSGTGTAFESKNDPEFESRNDPGFESKNDPLFNSSDDVPFIADQSIDFESKE